MSQENVDFVRRLWQINISRGAEACVEFATEDCVVEDFPELPDHAAYEGPEGMQEIDRHFREMWGEFVQEPVEFVDAGDDLVIAAVAMRGSGKSSGAPLDAQAFWVHEVRGRQIARMRAFTTRAQALEAAGLQE